MPNITIVPTSHIAEESIRKIRSAIETINPDCIAVELDAPRYHALKNKENASSLELIKNVGFATFAIFWLLKYLQQKLGGMVGVVPGADMLSAVDEAEKRRIRIAFIDMDIRMTAYKFKAEIPFSEKMRMVSYALKAVFFLSVGKYFVREGKGIDLTSVPEDDFISQAMKVFSGEFPNLYRILVTERNTVMAKNLIALASMHENIIAVVGAGHHEGLKEEIEKLTNANP